MLIDKSDVLLGESCQHRWVSLRIALLWQLILLFREIACALVDLVPKVVIYVDELRKQLLHEPGEVLGAPVQLEDLIEKQLSVVFKTVSQPW